MAWLRQAFDGGGHLDVHSGANKMSPPLDYNSSDPPHRAAKRPEPYAFGSSAPRRLPSKLAHLKAEPVKGRDHRVRLALDAAELASKIRTMEDLDRSLSPTFKSLGFAVFFGIQLRGSGEELCAETIFGIRSKDWEQYYGAKKYLLIDPVISEMLRSPEPSFWSDLAMRRGRLTVERRAKRTPLVG